MKNNIFIPKTIKVGYVERGDTYTGNLAYIIYIDAKGVVRKEKSWESWRDKKINPNDFANEPTSGFVLNKKAGGYDTGWNHRQTYCRVYDPRGFEFEIAIPNLLYILENTSAIKGKGLEGDFVYGWDGTELILIPTASPDYAQLTEFAESNFNKEKITSKNIVLGATYRTDKNEDWIYLGRFEEYETSTWEKKKEGESKGKKYFFQTSAGVITVSSPSKLIKTVDPNPASNYAELMDALESMTMYSPYNPDADVVTKISVEDLAKLASTVDNTWPHSPRYVNPEVVFTIDGIDLIAKLTENRNGIWNDETRQYDKFSIPKYSLSELKRRIPLNDDEYEYEIVKRSSGYYARSPSGEGWEHDYYYDNGEPRSSRYYGDQRYKRDKDFSTIKTNLKNRKLIECHSSWEDTYRTLDDLDKELGLCVRQKFLMNGKPLKHTYDEWVDFEYVKDVEAELTEAANG